MTRDADYYRRGFESGDRVALGRAITAVENEKSDAGAVRAAMEALTGRAHVVGLTGPPGVGKSTLVNALIGVLRARGDTVAVVAVDPSSPFSGGAILGDRIRMSEHAADPGVFVRSVASRGFLGGLSRSTARVVDVVDAAGYDTVLVETVGTGQAEVEIMHLAQTVVVAAAPGLGDEIQALKAGILEIAHIMVVNKADLPLADHTERQLHLATPEVGDDGWATPILRTNAIAGSGVEELADAIAAHYATIDAPSRARAPGRRARHQLAAAAAELIATAIRGGGAELEPLAEAVLEGSIPLADAALTAARFAVSIDEAQQL